MEQNVADAGFQVGAVGPATRITQFDEYGRRIYEMDTLKGPLAVVQGITEISPVFTRVQGMMGQD